MFKFDEEEFERERKRNFEQRLEFIKIWSDYMKKNSNKKWSKEQAEFIDSQYQK